MEYMRKENCNKAMCKSCIFRTDGNQTELSEERMNEIITYLKTFQSSHQYHITNLTCYGGMQVQAASMFKQC